MMMPKALMTMSEETTSQEGYGVGPRSDRPRRRTFTPADKLAHIEAYEEALRRGEGGAYLRRVGVHSASISEWRRQRDAGVFEGKKPGEKIGRPTREQAELGRLRRELDETKQELATTEIALEIMGYLELQIMSMSE